MLTMMIAQVCDLEAGVYPYFWRRTFTIIISSNCNLQLSRNQNLYQNDFESVHKDIFKFDDFTLEGYEPHALIKGNVAV
jgi:thymidylate synthase